jgi:hypothetical protein
MTRSARPVIPPLELSSMRYQTSRARSVATAAADTAGRSPHGAEGPRRHAPVGQAIKAMKVTPAHSPCTGEPPTCSGFAATSTLAAPAAARISRPGIAAGRSASAVAISHAPVTANAAVITHGSAASRSVRVLTVLASQLKEGGCRTVATVHPPTRKTRAAAAETTPHQGTRIPAATAGNNRAASLPRACLPAAFTIPIPSRSLAHDNHRYTHFSATSPPLMPAPVVSLTVMAGRHAGNTEMMAVCSVVRAGALLAWGRGLAAGGCLTIRRWRCRRSSPTAR